MKYFVMVTILAACCISFSRSNQNQFPFLNACSEKEQQESLFGYKLANANLNGSPLPLCQKEQEATLSKLGFLLPFTNSIFRSFILGKMLDQNNPLGRGISELIRQKDLAALQILSQLNYVIPNSSGSNKNDFLIKGPWSLFLSSSELNCSIEKDCRLKKVLTRNQEKLFALQKKTILSLDKLKASAPPLENGRLKEGHEGSVEARWFNAAEQAKLILEFNPHRIQLSQSDLIWLEYLKNLYDETVSPMFSGANSKILTTMIRADDTPDLVMSVLDSVQREDFLESWLGGTQHSYITAETSMSPLRNLMGPKSQRIIFWPWIFGHKGDTLEIDMSATRLSYLIDGNGVPKAIEVIARDYFSSRNPESRDGWDAFLFEKKWGRWLPATHVHKFTVQEFCLRCHSDSNQRMSPFPHNLTTPFDLQKVGYKTPSVIEALMKYK